MIPERRVVEYPRSTDARHTFVKKGVPAICRLQIFDGEQPRANQAYTFTIDGIVFAGTTDAQGKLEQKIPPDASEGKLVIGPDQMTYDLQFGHLDPVAEISGVQGRLINLGYDCGDAHGELDDRTRQALRAFQHRFQLPETGEPDDKTVQTLEHIHDRVSDFPQTRSSPGGASA